MRWVVELPAAANATATAVTVEADSWAGALTNARNGVPVKKFRCEFEDDGVVRVTNLETRERYTVRPFKSTVGASDAPAGRNSVASDRPVTPPPSPAARSSESPLFGAGGPPAPRAPDAQGDATASATRAPTMPGTTPKGGRERTGTLMAWPDLMADSEPSQVSGTKTMPPKPDRSRGAVTRTGQFRAASRSARPTPRTSDAPKPDLPMPSSARAALESRGGDALKSSPPTIPPGGVRVPGRVTSTNAPAAERTSSPGLTPSGRPETGRAPSSPLPPVTATLPPAETAVAPAAEARVVAERSPEIAPSPAGPSPVPAPMAAPEAGARDNGVSHAVNGAPQAGVETSLAESLPEPVVLFERNHEAGSQNPLTYRERVLVVPRGTTQAQAEQVARAVLADLRRTLATRPKGRYVTIAVFDHIFTSRPTYPPLVIVRWKDWRGEPEVTFPNKDPDGGGGGGSPAPAPSGSSPATDAGTPAGSPASSASDSTPRNDAPAAPVAPTTPAETTSAVSNEAPSATTAAAETIPTTDAPPAPTPPEAEVRAAAEEQVALPAPREEPAVAPTATPPEVAPAAPEPTPPEPPATTNEPSAPTAASAPGEATSPSSETDEATPLLLVPRQAAIPLVQKPAEARDATPTAAETTSVAEAPRAEAPTAVVPVAAAPVETVSTPSPSLAPESPSRTSVPSGQSKRPSEPGRGKQSKKDRKKNKRATAEQRLSTPQPAKAEAKAPQSPTPAATASHLSALATVPDGTPAAPVLAATATTPAATAAPATTSAASATTTEQPAETPAATAPSAETPAETPAIASAPSTEAAPTAATEAAETSVKEAAQPTAPATTASAQTTEAPAEASEGARTSVPPAERHTGPVSKPQPLGATTSSGGDTLRRATASAQPSAAASETKASAAPVSRSVSGKRRRGKDLLSDLFDALMELSFQATAEDACAFVAKLLRDNLTADACVVSLYDINRDEFVATGVEGAGAVGAREKATRGSRGAAVRRHLAVSHKKCEAGESVDPDWAGGPVVFIAAYHRDRLFGLVQLQRTPGGAVFEPDEEDGTSYVAAQLGEFLAQHSKRQAAAEYGEESAPRRSKPPGPRR